MYRLPMNTVQEITHTEAYRNHPYVTIKLQYICNELSGIPIKILVKLVGHKLFVYSCVEVDHPEFQYGFIVSFYMKEHCSDIFISVQVCQVESEERLVATDWFCDDIPIRNIKGEMDLSEVIYY